MDVQWLKNGNAISEDDYVNTPSVKEKTDDSSFMYSKLTIPKSSWDQGDIFSCMVIHEALEMKFTQKTIEKTS
ncbi:putative Ig gamma-2 chain C region protein, partial [Naja naja]